MELDLFEHFYQYNHLLFTLYHLKPRCTVTNCLGALIGYHTKLVFGVYTGLLLLILSFDLTFIYLQVCFLIRD